MQNFRSAVLDAWHCKVAGFRGGPLLENFGSLQLLNSAHVTERDKSFFQECHGLCWVGSEASLYLACSVVLLIMMVNIFGNAPSLLLTRFVKILGVMISRELIILIGLGLCCGMDGFPLLSGINGGSPLAERIVGLLLLSARVRVVRTMCIPCVLHGVEASNPSKGRFLKLRAGATSVPSGWASGL